ncbi:MAG: heat-shock protein Hsp20 [Conexibacter sp.]|nr:heat-shock protein Hsp20 [Conexibacter sp.]
MPLLVRRREFQSRPQQYAQPYRDLQDLQEQTAQLLQQVMPAMGAPIQPWIPDVDIEETEDAWIVEAELPGARAEDVHVEVHDGELRIHGEIVERERAGILRRRTRRAGEFEYQVTLPEPVDSENPQARMQDGLLEVRIPKGQRSRAREIPIQSQAAGGRTPQMPGGQTAGSPAADPTAPGIPGATGS